jgi:hypothetical protein
VEVAAAGHTPPPGESLLCADFQIVFNFEQRAAITPLQSHVNIKQQCAPKTNAGST